MNQPQKKPSKPIYDIGEDVCRVTKEQEERALTQPRKIKDIKIPINFKTLNGLDIENPNNFPNAETIKTVTASVGGE